MDITKSYVWAGLVLVALLVAGFVIFATPRASQPVACTADAKICPDGSSVGRSGPNCEFAACPGTASSSEACVAGACPLEIYSSDNGKTFTYSLTSRFTVILDENLYPKAALSCAPSGIIGPISNIPAVSPPLYAARFEAASQGQCVLSDHDFHVTIVVPAPDAAATTSEAETAAQSGVHGTVMLGPTCPVQTNPPQSNCAAKPYSTLVTIFPASDPVHAFVITHSDDSGAFSANLPPGDYTIGAGESNMARCDHPAITVSPTQYVSVTVSCDSGIR